MALTHLMARAGKSGKMQKTAKLQKKTKNRAPQILECPSNKREKKKKKQQKKTSTMRRVPLSSL